MQKILICDDDVAIVNSVEIFLKNEGFVVFKAFNGIEALKIIKQQELHLLILDIMMPEMDGLEVLRKVRENHNLPVLMVTAKSEDTDKIIGLNFGADDYLTKPYNPLELVARVKSQLRRYTHLGSQKVEPMVIKSGGLELDFESKVVKVDRLPVSLTPTELGILELLLRNKGKVFSIHEIYEAVWQDHSFAVDNTIAVHIRRMREKIEIDPKNPKYIKVVWGIGYKIENYS